MTTQHHFFSPSSRFPRVVLGCYGQPWLESELRKKKLIVDIETPERTDGIICHEHVNPAAAINDLTEAQRKAVLKAREYVASKVRGAINPQYEYRLTLIDTDGERLTFGTADVVAIFADGRIVIIDLKFGWGEPQAKIYTAQMGAYAPMAINALGGHPVDAYVYHVRDGIEFHHQFGAPVEELTADVRGWIELSSANRTHLEPSVDACLYCPCKPHCPALAQQTMELVERRFQLPTDEIKRREYLDKAESGIKWLKVIVDEIKRDAFDGGPVPAGKAVQTVRGNRYVADAEMLFNLLHDTHGVTLGDYVKAATFSMSKIRQHCGLTEGQFNGVADPALGRHKDHQKLVNSKE
jgi:hypothetical protein